MPESLKEMTPMLVGWGVKVVGVLIALWVAFRVAGWMERRLVAGLVARKFDAALTKFFASMARWLLIAAAVLACLGVFGVDTTSFAAVLGAAGLAVGLAFQGTLSNFSAGVMLLTFRPFDIDDLVKLSGQLGTVKEIGLFTTTVDTVDNRRVIIPNGKVIGDIIENLTANDRRRVDINVGTQYSADLNAVREILEGAASQVAGRDETHGHAVVLLELGESSINWQVRVWCKTEIYWDVWQATILGIKQALDTAKIGIPFPQRDLHLVDMPTKPGARLGL
jgi:small conductance mechanosensitive channel